MRKRRIKLWINKVFSFEKIDGGNKCPAYLFRWTLFKVKDTFAVYVHKFVASDWARDPHDHPKRFISIGLWGAYKEFVYEARDNQTFTKYVKLHVAPWVRSFPANHLHRIEAVNDRPCWTLVVTLKPVREWGFVQDGKWIEWKKYVWGGHSRKSC